MNSSHRRSQLGRRSLLLTTLLLSCRAYNDDSLVQIQTAVKADSSCNLAASNPSSYAGTYDPIASAQMQGEDGYVLGLVLRNNLEGRADEPLTLDTVTNVRNRFNDMKVLGFEGCWAQNDGSIQPVTAALGAKVLNCDALPKQSGTLPAIGSLDEGGDAQGAVSVRVLTLRHLRQLFGDGFSPFELPARGRYAVPGYDGNSTFFLRRGAGPLGNSERTGRCLGCQLPHLFGSAGGGAAARGDALAGRRDRALGLVQFPDHRVSGLRPGSLWRPTGAPLPPALPQRLCLQQRHLHRWRRDHAV